MSQEKRQRATEGAADRFLDLVDRSGFWKSVDLRFCAFRSGRRWVNLITRGFLDYRTSRSVPRLSPVDRRDFRAWQVVRPIADLSAVVRGIAGGMAKLRPRSVRYVQKSGQPTVDMRYSFSELAASYQTAEYDLWSCHTLVGYGSSIFDVVRQAGHDPFELDGMIRGGPNAYDGLPDLVRRFCARPRGLKIQGDTTVVELIAPLAARFDRESVASTPEHVTVALRAAADVFVAQAELVWTLGQGRSACSSMGQPSSREHAMGTGGSCSPLGSCPSPIRKGDDTATLFHSHRRQVRRLRVRAPSGLQSVDESAQRLRREAVMRSSRSCETRNGGMRRSSRPPLVLLLFFLGFQVDPPERSEGDGKRCRPPCF